MFFFHKDSIILHFILFLLYILYTYNFTYYRKITLHILRIIYNTSICQLKVEMHSISFSRPLRRGGGGLDSLKGHRSACAEPGLPRGCRRAEVSRDALDKASLDLPCLSAPLDSLIGAHRAESRCARLANYKGIDPSADGRDALDKLSES